MVTLLYLVKCSFPNSCISSALEVCCSHPSIQCSNPLVKSSPLPEKVAVLFIACSNASKAGGNRPAARANAQTYANAIDCVYASACAPQSLMLNQPYGAGDTPIGAPPPRRSFPPCRWANATCLPATVAVHAEMSRKMQVEKPVRMS